MWFVQSSFAGTFSLRWASQSIVWENQHITLTQFAMMHFPGQQPIKALQRFNHVLFTGIPDSTGDMELQKDLSLALQWARPFEDSLTWNSFWDFALAVPKIHLDTAHPEFLSEIQQALASADLWEHAYFPLFHTNKQSWISPADAVLHLDSLPDELRNQLHTLVLLQKAYNTHQQRLFQNATRNLPSSSWIDRTTTMLLLFPPLPWVPLTLLISLFLAWRYTLLGSQGFLLISLLLSLPQYLLALQNMPWGILMQNTGSWISIPLLVMMYLLFAKTTLWQRVVLLALTMPLPYLVHVTLFEKALLPMVPQEATFYGYFSIAHIVLFVILLHLLLRWSAGWWKEHVSLKEQ